MKYNFDSIIDRKNTNSLKWDLFDDEYPMWVADMDFLAAPLIQDSLENNVKQGSFRCKVLLLEKRHFALELGIDSICTFRT